VTVDAAALDRLARLQTGAARLAAGRWIGAWVAVCTGVATALALAPHPVPAIARLALFLALTAAFFVTAWQAILDASDRARLRLWWLRARGSVSR
jgi:hypothetical protein